MISWLYPVLAGLALAAAAYALASLIPAGQSPASALAAFQGTPLRSQTDAWGEGLVQRMPFSLAAWQAHLVWARRGGAYQGVTIGRVLLMSLLMGGLGLLVPLWLTSGLLFWSLPLLGAAQPWMALRSKANAARKQAERSIPDVATLLAAELATGVPPDEALQRAVAFPGPLAVLIREAVQLSQRTGRPLFSRTAVHGTLVEVLAAAEVPALRAFAVQLDLVAGKGVAGATMMGELAKTLGQAYREQIINNVEKLDNQLTLGVTIFYFAPMILLILGSFFAAVIEAM